LILLEFLHPGLLLFQLLSLRARFCYDFLQAHFVSLVLEVFVVSLCLRTRFPRIHAPFLHNPFGLISAMVLAIHRWHQRLLSLVDVRHALAGQVDAMLDDAAGGVGALVWRLPPLGLGHRGILILLGFELTLEGFAG